MKILLIYLTIIISLRFHEMKQNQQSSDHENHFVARSFVEQNHPE